MKYIGMCGLPDLRKRGELVLGAWYSIKNSPFWGSIQLIFQMQDKQHEMWLWDPVWSRVIYIRKGVILSQEGSQVQKKEWKNEIMELAAELYWP